MNVASCPITPGPRSVSVAATAQNTAIGATRDPMVAFLLVVAGIAIISCATSINAALKAELFPVHVRALGVGLPYAVSQSIFGGSAETLALSLKQVLMRWREEGGAGRAGAVRAESPRRPVPGRVAWGILS